MNRVPHWTGGPVVWRCNANKSSYILWFFQRPNHHHHVKKRLGNDCITMSLLGYPAHIPLFPRYAAFSGVGCQVCQSSRVLPLHGGDVSSPCILFYNPQRWDFIAQQCVCLWHSPKQDLLPPRQMWLESIMPCKHTLSEQPLGSLQDFSFFFPSFIQYVVDVRESHHNRMLVRALWVLK